MSIQNVVLGELIWRRGYGYGYEVYDQVQELCEALGYSESIVYAALQGLARRGLIRVVDREAAVAGGRQASTRVYYAVTESGQRRFQRWMAAIPRKAPLREDLHMQLMEATTEDLPHMVDALTSLEEECREHLGVLLERPLRSGRAGHGAPGPQLVREGLILHYQATLEWVERSRRSLLNFLDGETGVPGRRRP